MRAIKVGVVGVGRGMSFAFGAGEAVGMRLVALCDQREAALKEAAARLGEGGAKVTTYTDFDRFLEHDLDAVVLANYFHQHAPLAIKALESGRHVMSETTSCFTLAEGAALVEAVERSGRIYMLAENYPYMVFNQEMRRLYRSGRMGTFMYGEGEYIHPMDAVSLNRLSPGVHHWRNWIPATYYCTHSLAPLMFITDTMPVKVNGFVIPERADDPVRRRTVRTNDPASMIAVRMDDGSVVKLLQVGLRGEGIWVRVHCSRGAMENLRHGDRNTLWVRREQYHERKTTPPEQVYAPGFPVSHDRAVAAGHGGGDYFTNYHFARAIRSGRQPFLDVYRGVAMSAVGILAYRSALQDSAPFAIPDFRDQALRRKLADDHWSPDPETRTSADPWPSARGEVTISPEARRYAEKVWKTTRERANRSPLPRGRG